MSQARAAIIQVTPFQQNCTLLWCEATRRAAVIDPGGDLELIRDAIAKTDVSVEKVWLTHGHIDHAGGAAELAERLGVPVEGPQQGDLFLLQNLAVSGRGYGMSARNLTPDRWLVEGDVLELGELRFDLWHCPGHSPGSVVFSNSEQRFAIMGDVLFRGSIGRTDLPGGDFDTLMASIRGKVLPLGDDVAFVCGHGPTSTIGHERATNPFLQ
jgi:glyoxylase-like metal-dependent hydrolase (beta-lactamase superfamily II)